jgi:hypothetical protein
MTACRSSNLVMHERAGAARLMISMPVSRTHRSQHDAEYETKIQSALEGLHSGKYTNIKEAAKEEGVSALSR